MVAEVGSMNGESIGDRGSTRRRLLRGGAMGLLVGFGGCSSVFDGPSSDGSPNGGSDGAGTDSSGISTATATTPPVPEGLWPMSRYDSAGTVHNPHVTVDADASVQWRVSVGGDRAEPLYSNGYLYASHGTQFTIVDTEGRDSLSGRLPMNVLAVWDDALYYSGIDRDVTAAIDPAEMLATVRAPRAGADATPTGAAGTDDVDLHWQVEYSIGIGTRVGDGFYGVTRDGRVVALDAASGAEHWSRDPPFEPTGLVVTMTDAVLYNDARMVALDRASGEERWTAAPDLERVRKRVDLADGIEALLEDDPDASLQFGGVTVSAGALLVIEINPRYGIRVVSARDPSTGDPIWYQSPAVFNGATDDRFFSPVGVWNAGDGTSQWRVGDDPPFGSTAPISTLATRNHVLVAASHPDDVDAGRLVAFDQEDGSRSWVLDTEDRICRCIAVDETIFATTTAGTLLAVS